MERGSTQFCRKLMTNCSLTFFFFILLKVVKLAQSRRNLKVFIGPQIEKPISIGNKNASSKLIDHILILKKKLRPTLN